MPWWGWVLVGFGSASMLFTWARARAAARGDAMVEEAWQRRDRDVTQWNEQRWTDEATKIVNDLKRQAAEEKGSDA